MSANFYCWEPDLGPNAKDFLQRIDDLYEMKNVAASDLMLRLVDALTARYPDLDENDTDTVWAAGPLEGEIIGRFINMAVIWPRAEEAFDFVKSTAHRLGLHFYDPQSERFYPAP